MEMWNTMYIDKLVKGEWLEVCFSPFVNDKKSNIIMKRFPSFTVFVIIIEIKSWSYIMKNIKYRNKELILYNQEYLDYICIINIFIYLFISVSYICL